MAPMAGARGRTTAGAVRTSRRGLEGPGRNASRAPHTPGTGETVMRWIPYAGTPLASRFHEHPVLRPISAIAPPRQRVSKRDRRFSDFVSVGAGRPRRAARAGVFHFDDQGLDTYQPRFKLDVLAPNRQRELDRLIDQLAAFRPTRVAVEARPTEQRRLDSLYAAFVDDAVGLGPITMDSLMARIEDDPWTARFRQLYARMIR